MLQIGRNLTDAQSGALHAKRYLIIDRDTKYSQQFRRLIQDSGTKVIRLPPMSPNLNAYAERFVRSIKDECLRSDDLRWAGIVTPCRCRIHGLTITPNAITKVWKTD